MQVAGFVLVGGKSARMSRDKARLPVRTHLLVEEVAATVGCIAQSVALVGEARRYRDLKLECLDDLRPELGPLGGIEAALATQRAELNLIVACDIANLRVEWLRVLVAKAAESDRPCVVSKDATGIIQPLCSVWKLSCLSAVRQALDCGRLRVLEMIEELGADCVRLDARIHNVNTPQEWESWQEIEGREAARLG